MIIELLTTLPIAAVDLGWISIFAMSGSIALVMGATIMTTVWLTGGFGKRS